MTILPVASLVMSLALGVNTAQADDSQSDAAGQDVVAFELENGVTKPIFSYANAIREYVWVEAPFDGDLDGKNDLIRTDIIRPSETAAAGIKVPVIMDPSPYQGSLGRGNESQLKKYDANGNPTQMPLFLDNYFVPRGYAYVLPDVAGTNLSEGCVDIGGQYDVGSMKAAVDWLNGNAVAYRDKERTQPVLADWTNGKTASIGKSYDGALTNALAATGVEGLVTIVPISGMTNQYDWYRANGALYTNWHEPLSLANVVYAAAQKAKCTVSDATLPAGAAQATGNYNSFWDARNYIKDISKVKASVLISHGLNDLNVKMDSVDEYWKQLGERGIPRKIWLSQRGHVDPFDARRAEWVSTLHRWFDYWLLGVQNGIMTEPLADIETAPDVWQSYATWPVPGTKNKELNFKAGSTPGLGELTIEDVTGTASFTDAYATEANYASVQTARTDRLLYTSPVLTNDVHFSGTPSIKLKATSSLADTNLTFMVVDYGTGTRVSGEGVTTGTVTDCWGESTALDSACFKKVTVATATAPYYIVSRGWISAEHRDSLSNPTPLIPGTPFDVQWDGLAHDYTFVAGHKIGVIVTANVRSRLLSMTGRAAISLDLAGSSVTLPIVGNPVPEWVPASSSAVVLDNESVVLGQTHKATVTVSSAGGVPTGSVDWYVDGSETPFTTSTLDGSGVASAQFAGLTAGNHEIVASYSGNDSIAASESAAVVAQVYYKDYSPTNPGPFYQDIQWLASSGITTGYADGTFKPARSVNRDAMAAFLYRFAHPGAAIPACTEAPASDVPVSSPFCGAIKWVMDEEISTGYADGTFRPGLTISREAMAAFLFRFAVPETTIPTCVEAPFTDVKVGSPFCGAIAWAKTNAISTGDGDGTFKPTATVSRQAMAAFLHRLDSLA